MQASEILGVLAIVLSLIGIAGVWVLIVMLRSYRRNQRIIMGSRGTVDVAEHMAIIDDKLTNLRLAVEDLALTASDHGVRIDGTLSHVGIVRFDAYRDLGGRQSTAVAFLNSRNDGVLITTVVSREFARMYVKIVKDGVGDIPLAPEENEAVQQAQRATPFIVKPAADGDEERAIPTVDNVAMHVEGQPMVASLPSPYEDENEEARRAEIENRMRRRKGMPLIEHADLAPSTQGWQEPATPSISMAEQFLQERRLSQQASAPEEGSYPADDSAEQDDEYAPPELAAHDDEWSSSKDDDGWGFDLPVDDDTHEL